MLRNLVDLNYGVSLAATLAADANGAGIDRQGYAAAAVVFIVGIGGITFDTNNRIDFKIEHSDDNTTFVGTSQFEIQAGVGQTITVGTGGIVKSLIAAHPAADATKVDYIGSKRYIRAVADFSGTHGSGTPITALVVLGEGNLGPVA